MTQPTVEGVDHPAQDEEAEVEHGAHPTEAKYIKVALVLAVITAVEVGLFYTEFSEAATNAALMVLAAVKFIMVVAYFMHLKFDNKLLRRLFITGFVLAASVYVAYLMTLGVFLP